jgi:hypothetical protein
MFIGDSPVAKGELVGMGDLLIPIVEYKWHNPSNGRPPLFLWDEYTWHESGFSHMKGEVDKGDRISVAAHGLGAVPNAYTSLANVVTSEPKISRAMEGTSPGVGAITPHHDRAAKAKSDIPPGAEILIE